MAEGIPTGDQDLATAIPTAGAGHGHGDPHGGTRTWLWGSSHGQTRPGLLDAHGGSRIWCSQDPEARGCALSLGQCPLPWGSGGARLCSSGGRAGAGAGAGPWPEPPAPLPTPGPALAANRSREQRRLVAGAGSLPFLQEGPGAGQGARVRIWPLTSTCRGGGEGVATAAGDATGPSLLPLPAMGHGDPRDTPGHGNTGLCPPPAISGAVLGLELPTWGLTRVPIPAMSPSPVPHSHTVPWPHGHLLHCPHSCPLQCPQVPGWELSWAQRWWGQDWPSFPWQFPQKRALAGTMSTLSWDPGEGPSPARASDTHVPPGSVPMPRKGGRAQDTGGLGRFLFKKKQLWGQLVMSSSTSQGRNSLLWPHWLCSQQGWRSLVWGSPQTAPRSLRYHCQGHPGAGWGSASEMLQAGRVPGPAQRGWGWCRGWRWQVPMEDWGWQGPVGCSGLEWDWPTPGIPFSGSVAVPGPERRHQKRTLTAGAGEPQCPWGRGQLVQTRSVLLKLEASGWRPRPHRGSGRHWGGWGRRCGGAGAGAGSSLASPITRAHRASWAWPARG